MKRSSPFTCLLFVIIAVLPLTLIAQQPTENSLLWRISGKGLTKPSWLYGTIHLTDKRVFNFGDSLYAALEACDGYAMEVDPDSMINALFREDEEDQLLKKAVSAKDFNRMKKKLQEKFDKSPELVTVKEFRNYYNNFANSGTKDAMHTIMDAWFYDAVKRQGKWVGGVEDASDQQGLSEVTPVTEYVEDFITDHKESRAMLERMIKIYQAEDLGGVKEVEEATDSVFIDKVMLRRNRKMARRMDSLAHIRSTFFAVGSGHLPGDSGVISYLRRMGFTVQPVKSSKRIAAGSYRFTVKEMPWVTVRSATDAFTVQMPAEPQDAEKLSGEMDMKVYADIGANLVYLVMSVEGNENLNVDSMMLRMVKNMNKRASDGEIRDIENNGIRGKELVSKGPEATYRLRCFVRPPMVYLILVGSSVDSLVQSADAERFFNSLVMHKKAPSGYVPWSVYTSDRHAFSVKFPAKPVVKTNAEQAPDAITTFYSSLDLQNGLYAQCLVQDMKKGFHLTSDTATFSVYRAYLDSNANFRVLRSRLDTVLQCPAMWVEFMTVQGKASYYNKVLSLHRGNRIYYLFTTVEDSIKNRKAINDYFSSFLLQPYKETQWAKHDAPDNSFTVWSAGPAELYNNSSYNELLQKQKRTMFELYDSVAPCTWYVSKLPYSRNYWTDSDTSLLRRTVNRTLGYGDSVLSFSWVTNSGYKGAEAVIDLGDNHNMKKMRLLIVGDTLVEVYGFAPPEIISQDNTRRLYEEFSVNYKVSSTLFTSKAEALLRSLQTKDSADFAEAKNLLELVDFTKADLPFLHKAMVEQYQDNALNYASANNKIFWAIARLKDPSSLDAIREAWMQLPPSGESLRYWMLKTLADFGTDSSYRLAKDLLLQHPPQEGQAWAFFNGLQDTLQLAVPYFPELLPLLRDSLACWEMLSMTEKMLDSNLIDKWEVAKYREDLYKLANKALVTLKTSKDPAWYNYSPIIGILARLEEPVAYQWVRKFLLQSNMYLKHTAAFVLLKHKQPVESTELVKLAADKEQRIELYNDLKELNKIALFPKKYLTQQAFGESELYSGASEENEIGKMTFIGERVATYKGARKKFYLFRVDVSYDDEKHAYLGIAGPYDLKPGAPLVTESRATGIYWEKDYNAATIDSFLKAHLKEMERYED